MKYALIALAVFFGCAVVLGPVTRSLVLPAGITGVMDEIGRIF